MTTFVTIIYVIVAFMMVLAILLQAGKGGGLGSALGGGASQGVFGGGGGGDFMAKLTQGMAATFMICAMYLAYASAHAGSEFLAGEDKGSTGLLAADTEIDYEFIGPNPQKLPTPEEGKAKQAAAASLVPAVSELPRDGGSADVVPTDTAPTPAPTPAEGDVEGANENSTDSEAEGTVAEPAGKAPSDDE
jgi:preprotein translocase subunit SecG